MQFDLLRTMIPATNDMTYFNTGWIGPSSSQVVSRISEVLSHESSVGPASLEGLELAQAVQDHTRRTIANAFGALPEEILLTHGTTEGVNVVLHGMHWEYGDELVTCDLEHPALRDAANVLAERKGIVVRDVVVTADMSEDEIVEGFRAVLGVKTRIVAFSHVQYSCGLRMPVGKIVEAAHQFDVPVLVDGAQSAGQIALDLHELRADFYAISGQKWLLGPVGTGALFISRQHIDWVHPLFISVDDGAPSYMESSARVDRLSIASQSMGLLAGLDEAIRILVDFGLDRIEDRCMGLSAQVRKQLSEIPGCGITSPWQEALSCGLVSFTVRGMDPQTIVNELWGTWRIAARRVVNPTGVRFSMAAFNTESEIDLAIQAIAALPSQGKSN